jgi:hypothetical protein
MLLSEKINNMNSRSTKLPSMLEGFFLMLNKLGEIFIDINKV